MDMPTNCGGEIDNYAPFTEGGDNRLAKMTVGDMARSCNFMGNRYR